MAERPKRASRLARFERAVRGVAADGAARRASSREERLVANERVDVDAGAGVTPAPGLEPSTETGDPAPRRTRGERAPGDVSTELEARRSRGAERVRARLRRTLGSGRGRPRAIDATLSTPGRESGSGSRASGSTESGSTESESQESAVRPTGRESVVARLDLAPCPSPAPPPTQEGRLLVWRDTFDAASWIERSGPALFGPAATGPAGLCARVAARGFRPEETLWLDIESCGLGAEPIFLVGLLEISPERFDLVQLLAPDPSAEPEMLRALTERLALRPRWVSFNGRSFDVPRLRRRAFQHSIAFPDPSEHHDLLIGVRRRWKTKLPNCRLSTCEERLLGMRRLPGDVPGREVPQRYWDYVHTGERRWIDPVIEHNRRDVAALLALWLRVLGG